MTKITGNVTAWNATAPGMGAISAIQLHGDVEHVLRMLDDRANHFAPGTVRLADFFGIDTGVVARVDHSTAFLMPHGGELIGRSLLRQLGACGVDIRRSNEVDPTKAYPEAVDELEAAMLAAIPRLQGKLGLALLLDQPRRRRTCMKLDESDHPRAARLNRLFSPPLVVIAGPANVGKSTLVNALSGRIVAIEADLPGTTRDYTVTRISLGGLVCHIIDTPGLRAHADDIERMAVERSLALIGGADCLIAMTDHAQPWPQLSREADFRVANKSDRGLRPDAAHSICALKGEGIDNLVHAVREFLLPQADLDNPRPWLFDADPSARKQEIR